MAKKRKKRSDHPLAPPGYDALADRGRDTGPPTASRVVVCGKQNGSTRNYALDPLLFMLNRGTITARLAKAGTRFRLSFNAAAADGPAVVDWHQPPGSGGNTPLWPHGGRSVIVWGEEVQPALDALGKADNPMRLVAWHVLGYGKSLRVFAETVGWEGVKPRDSMAASGLLTAALATLADHYEART